MFTKRVFLSLIMTAAMATVVSAQSNDKRAGWAAKMARRSQTGVLATGPSASIPASEADDDDKGRLEGTWRSTESFGDVAFRVLYTFGAGKNPNNGIVVHSDELFLVAAPSCLNSQGVWKRTGERRFTATDEGFCFDTNAGFAPAGKIKFEAAIRLNQPGNEFDGTLHIEGFDVDGNLVFSDDAVLHGVRMRP